MKLPLLLLTNFKNDIFRRSFRCYYRARRSSLMNRSEIANFS